MTVPTKAVLAGELTTMSLGSGSGVSAVGQVLSIDPIGEQRAKVSTVTLGDVVKTNRLSTLVDVKDCKVTLLYDATNHATLQGWLAAGTVQTVTFAMFAPAAVTATKTYTNLGAYCSDYSITGIKEDGNVQIEITIAFNDVWTTT